MQMYLSRAHLFPISLIVGLIVGYLPAIWYFQSRGVYISKNFAMINVSYTTIRGVITGVDVKSKTLTLVAVSPYSPHESAPFNVTFDDSTLFRWIPAISESRNLFLPSSVWQEIDEERLVMGAPVTVRVSRGPGALHAFWISTRAPTE